MDMSTRLQYSLPRVSSTKSVIDLYFMFKKSMHLELLRQAVLLRLELGVRIQFVLSQRRGCL